MDVTAQRDSRDDGMPPDCARIEVRVGEVRQLFNSMDPAPFRERDLDPKAEEFIVESARELGRRASLGLVVRLSRAAGAPEDLAANLIGEARLFDRLGAMHVQVVHD